MSMTPLGFKNWYLAIEVTIRAPKVEPVITAGGRFEVRFDDGFGHLAGIERPATVSVHRYHMHGYDDGIKNADAKAAKKALNEALGQGTSRSAVASEDEVARVYTGKGSPTDIARVLETAVSLGVIEPTKEALKKHCDKCIGVDCSGFVNAYWRCLDAQQTNEVNDFTLISHHHKRQKPPRASVAEFQSRDMLISCTPAGEVKTGPGHITLLDQVLTASSEGTGMVRIVEAAGSNVGICESHGVIREVLRHKEGEYFRLARTCKRFIDGDTVTLEESYVRVVPGLV